MSDENYRKKENYEPLAQEDPVAGTVFFDQVLERFNIDIKDPANQVIVQWASIVGPEIAAHCRCDGISKGTLYVSCDHPSRASAIRLNSREILKKIGSAFPEIDLKKIVTRIRQLPTT